ncbi:hypothetical protein AVEN_10908-1 [Araneus ventricosus]|uniref:Uncharacterized protein n=1 Tax=Araneus ventricosus TaxID=182803 RepID=A0A4Y2SP62_ARAVE|nr:hypothetical protein AVEN_10908-1 [Araneus ventricosus]
MYAVPQFPEGVIFHQDGAPPHYGNIVREFLDITFPQRWIGRGAVMAWPPRSLYITPLDFYLWGYVKQHVYSEALRKGVDGFSVETSGLLTDPNPIWPSSYSLTDDWAPTGISTNVAITKLSVDYVMHSSFAYRQFNSSFTCGDPTILLYDLIHSRKRGTVDHNVRLPRAWQVLDVYASAS